MFFFVLTCFPFIVTITVWWSLLWNRQISVFSSFTIRPESFSHFVIISSLLSILLIRVSRLELNSKIFCLTFQLLFDKEFESNPIEKIKIISSTYMAACGLLPGRNGSLETPLAVNEPFNRYWRFKEQLRLPKYLFKPR